MKIVIVYVNTSQEVGMGIAYISAMLKKHGYNNITLLDTYYFNDKDVLRKIKEICPDVVLFSVHSLAYPHAVRLSRRIKEIKNIPIMFGGLHPTMPPNEVIKEQSIDMICVGEGEYAVVDVLNDMERRDVKNIWYKDDGEIIHNPLRPLANLDDLPFPDREIFDKRSIIGWDDTTTFSSSRGCPYSCSYCCNKYIRDLYREIKSNYIRFRSIEDCIEELKLLKDRYKPKEIWPVDEDFLTKRERVVDFCEAYKEEIAIPFGFMTRPEHVYKDEELIKILKDAGCKRIHMGVESGDYFTRKSINRDMPDQLIIDAFKMCRKHGIKTAAFNIIGFPWETKETIKKTYELNKKCNPDVCQFTILYPFKKTEIYDVYKERGFLIENQPKYEDYYREIIISLPNLPPRKLKQIENYMHTSFNRSEGLGKIVKITPPEWLYAARKIFNALTRR